MNTIRTIAPLGSMVCLLTATFWMSTAYAQQSTAAPGAEQEFFDAIKKGDSAKVAELLKQQPALIKMSNKRGITPVLYAVYAKHPEIAESFIATGIELNIFEAVATRRIDLVRELLKKDRGLIHAWSADGWTALHLNFNNLEMARLLIDSGADLNLNSRNKLNATPLQGAAANNWIDLAKLYLSRGANVNCRSEAGGSPLHEAAGNGFLEFAKLLLENGAHVNQKDDNGKTPLTIALEFKHPEIAEFLKKQGAVQ